MRTLISRYFPLILLGLAALFLARYAATQAADPPLKVTPDTTDPSTLTVAVTIDDDQNATDGKVGITMQFATDEILDPKNYIQFMHGEEVSCNGVQLMFNDPNYTARVTRPDPGEFFTCVYTRNGQPYQLMHLPARTNLILPLLKPPLLLDMKLQNSNFDIYYHADMTLPLCQMNVTLSDSSTSNSIRFTESRSGVFPTSITTFSGVGSLILTRMCPAHSRGIQTESDTVDPHAAIPLDSVDITYKSTYRLYETWEPPA
jgi:hypothetical protein